MAKSTARFDQLVRVYVDAHEFAAIVISADGSAAFVPGRFDWSERYAGVWWHADRQKLEALAAGIAAGIDKDDIERLILLGAERNNIRLTDHAIMIDRARGAVAMVDVRIKGMQVSGDMQALHTKYQDARLRQKECGKGMKPFWMWMHDRKIEMVRSVAVAASGRKPTARPQPDAIRRPADGAKNRARMARGG